LLLLEARSTDEYREMNKKIKKQVYVTFFRGDERERRFAFMLLSWYYGIIYFYSMDVSETSTHPEPRIRPEIPTLLWSSKLAWVFSGLFWRERKELKNTIEDGEANSAIRFLNQATKGQWATNQNRFFIATKSEKDTEYTLLTMTRIQDKVFSFTSKTQQKFQITFRSWVGLNQQFSAALPMGFRIYGIAFPVTTQYAGKSKTNESYSFVSYVPYEPLLDNNEKRTQWLNYLKTSFRQAHEKIKTANIRSQAFPGKKVHEIIPYWLPMMFNIVEHMDNNIYIGSQKDGILKPREEVFKLMGDKMGEVFYQYASNKRATYNYSLSSEGALGTAQMMPGPYGKLAWEFYPQAKLNPSFITGMQDHTNAMMAQILWFDDILKTFPTTFKKDYLLFIEGKSQDTDIVGILGASYNKGTSISGELKRGKKWENIFERLPIESQIYFHKTRYVRQELQSRYALREIPASPNTARVGLEFQDPGLIEWANKRTIAKKSKEKMTELERERREMVMKPAFRTYADIADGIRKKNLILVPEGGQWYELLNIGMYEIDPSKKNLLRALDPPTFRMLEEIARGFHLRFPNKKLPITSLARPQEYYDKIPSHWNHKASDGRSSHMHNLAFDIGISRMQSEERKWLNIELKWRKDKQVILTALEGKNAMHVFVRPVDNVKPQGS
jgi:hypothetical protein